jgi:nitric oxide reductase activation protein
MPPITPQGQQPDNGSNLPPDMQKRMEKEANKQRQTELKRDTEKLLKLSTELKEYVDKSNENVLSLDVVKKADAIEKLAHSVKIKMRGDNFAPSVPSAQ